MANHWGALLLLAFALSLDSFGVGVTYGLRKMKIPLLSIAIISVCSGLVIGISMQLGALLSRVLSPVYTTVFGAVILICIGCYSLIQALQRKEDLTEETAEVPRDLHLTEQVDSDSGHISALAEKKSAENANTESLTSSGRDLSTETSLELQQEERTLFSLEFRKWGLVIRILRSPSAADMDRSGSISATEAVWLGIALSVDAFGAGLGAAMLGFQPLSTALAITLFSGVFLIAGMKAGFFLSAFRFMKALGVLPALLLIMMGILKLL
ncbi:MntP/YtaF family protein [Paenibacillus polymyxa]|uniref:Sporulation protein ytaf n=1 Tax=Paenibacillus polymyxa TaxID=1406 RepID=A0A0F0G974_PAEPO|nr:MULTISPECIES: MntP/YtaF family protein [Paenibacillus]MDP9676663.1 putative Mn2+ efflux pump MntP [Paenibacillus jamilae]AHM65338.1 sporulation protein ytaf [Paenibacillus polymyxa SQR-21]AIY10861.1 membrane protein [Paenibacillus polymyxa]AUS25897.1 membrane protein [Paenibacillus polymyxa]KAE8558638.1 sporulation membrane protein YtaF [Paenibacillus polymyxa]